MWIAPGSSSYAEWSVDQEVRALVSARQGGVSAPPFDSLNLSFSVNDDQAAVALNRAQVARWFGRSTNAMVFAEQVHENAVHVATLTDAGSTVARTDGLISDQRGVVLSLLFADCVPIFLAAPKHGWVGILHAGWRGTAANIAQEAVSRLGEHGVPCQDLWAGIGPSIGSCCYEVDDPVISQLEQVEGAGVPASWSTPGRPGHFQLDLWELNRRLLRAAGLPGNHIEISGLCTACHPQWFFSHRRDHGRTGRIGSFICRR